MHWKNLANYDYLGSYSFENITDSIDVTIKEVKKVRVTAPGGNAEDCIVAYFDETNEKGVEVKPMILNKTNCKAIEKAIGSGDIESWIGKCITIYVTETKFAREMVPCLRIKTELPQFKCAVCGKDIEKKLFSASVAKYGKAYCSKECMDKDTGEVTQ